jgi:hypothetical protein
MADDETQRPSGVPEFDSASAPDRSKSVERTQGGRGASVDDSPEGRLLREGTATISNPAPLAPDLERDRFKELDDAAADEARNDVRRREHSAD